MENVLKVLMTLDSKQLVQGLNQAQSRIDKFSGNLRSVGKTLMTRVSAPLSIVGGMALKQSMNFQKLRMSLETLSGSAEAGGAAFEELVKFSAKTPFQLNELVRINNMLMGFGLNTTQARESLKLLGDVAAVSGGDLTGMAVAFGQSAAEGRVMTRDLLQFINNGVPLLKLLAEELGTTTTRVREMASEGQLSFPLVVKALQRATSAGGMFDNGMEKLSKTLAGTYSNIKDNLSIALATLGDQIVNTFDVEQLGKDFVGFIQDVTKSFKEMEPATKDLVIQIAAFAASAGPLMYLAGSVIPKLVGSIRYLIAHPIIAGLTAAAGALGLLIDRVGDIEDANEKAKKGQEGILKYGEALKNLEQTRGYVDGNVESLKKWHETNLLLQQSIKQNAEAQISFAKDLGPDGADTVKKYTTELNNANSMIKVSEAALKSFDKQVVTNKPGLEAFNQTIGGTNDELERLKQEAELIAEGKAFEKAFDPMIKVGMSFSEAFKDVEEFDPNSVAVAEEIPTDGLDALIQKWKEYKEAINQVAYMVGDVLKGAFENLMGGGDFFQPLINGLKRLMVQILAAAAAAAILFILTGGASAGGSSLGSLKEIFGELSGLKTFAGGENVAGTTPFANGGIVSGPTLGLIGEYSGARSNPEVVAPLNKLQGMLAQSGGQNVNVGGEFRIQGQDLVVALQRAERNRKRIL